MRIGILLGEAAERILELLDLMNFQLQLLLKRAVLLLQLLKRLVMLQQLRLRASSG